MKYCLKLRPSFYKLYDMFDHDKNVLKGLSDILRRSFSNEIEGIYAFGSRVRGDNDDHSDFDVLIVVKGKTPAKEEKIISVLVDYEMEHGYSFIPVIKDAVSFAMEKKYNAPFYQNIIKEGICL